MSVSGEGQYPVASLYEYRGDYEDWTAKGLRVRLVWRLQGVWKKRLHPWAEVSFDDVMAHFSLGELGSVGDVSAEGRIAESLHGEPTVFVAPVSAARSTSVAAESFVGLPADAVAVYAPDHSPQLGPVLDPSDVASLMDWVHGCPERAE